MLFSRMQKTVGLTRIRPLLLMMALVWVSAVACGPETGNSHIDFHSLSGQVRIDGSSTVYLISKKVADRFKVQAPKVMVPVDFSGTVGGFRKFCVGETDINDASRAIKPNEQVTAESKGIAYLEFPIAFDGLSVMVNPANTFVDFLSIEELKRIWMVKTDVKYWSDVRAHWPKEPIILYGAGRDSGTFDYFCDAVVGSTSEIRPDFSPSEDDNVLVQGIAGHPYAIGFFGYAYYVKNRDKLRVVPIDNGKGPVAPSDTTILNGSYAPLSRPLFIYVNTQTLKRPEVRAFVEFYMQQARSAVAEVGYTPQPEKVYKRNIGKLKAAIEAAVK